MTRSEVETGAAARQLPTDARLFADRIRLLYSPSGLLPVNLVLGGVTCAMFWGLFPAWVILLWLALFAVTILARAVAQYCYRRALTKAPQHWAQLIFTCVTAYGLVWGAAGVGVLLTPDPLYHMLIVFVLGGMVAGSTMVNAAYLPVFYGFSASALAPAILILITRTNAAHIEMGITLAVYFITLAIVGRQLSTGICANFTMQYQQEALSAQLRHSAKTLAEAQSIAHVGSWEHDANGDYWYWSDEVFRIFGVDPAVFKPSLSTLRARIHKQDLPRYNEYYANSLTSRVPTGLGLRILTDHGAIKSVHVSGRSDFDADGRFIRAVGTVQDITERKDADDKLEFANVLLKAEMEASPDGIVVVDEQGMTVSFSQKYADMWDIRPEEMLGSHQVALEKIRSVMKEPQAFSSRVQYINAHTQESFHDELESTTGKFVERHT